MTQTLSELNSQENYLIRSVGGVLELPEAYDDLNNLQRDKIQAMKDEFGTAYIGSINYYGDERENLTPNNVYKEYIGQMVYNFDANFVVPVEDEVLANMVYEWNQPAETHTTKNLVGKIINRIEEVGGMYLIFT